MASSFPETIDSTKLIKQLSGAWGISETQKSVFHESAARRPEPQESRGRSSGVGISAVSTFVAKKSFNNFVVSPFASHWGVVIDFNEQTRFLYHLLFDVEDRKVTFEVDAWKPQWSKHQVKHVGNTLYGAAEVYQIGKEPIFYR